MIPENSKDIYVCDAPLICSQLIDLQRDLPDSWHSWRTLPFEQFHRPWDTLRVFFSTVGYDLYQGDHEHDPTSRRQESPADDSFELYGDRGDGFVCYMVPASSISCQVHTYLSSDYMNYRQVPCLLLGIGLTVLDVNKVKLLTSP